MSKHGNIMLSGKSGEKYCFQSWSFDTRFRAVGAVFLVTKRVYKNKTYRRASHDVIYIGETSAMSEPLASVSQLQSFEKDGANCLCVCPVTDEAQRTRIVDDLLAAYSWPSASGEARTAHQPSGARSHDQVAP